ncbi:hypothetical protein ABZP36_027725 [Zizania latifolia]
MSRRSYTQLFLFVTPTVVKLWELIAVSHLSDMFFLRSCTVLTHLKIKEFSWVSNCRLASFFKKNDSYRLADKENNVDNMSCLNLLLALYFYFNHGSASR